ncbi:Rho guanyl-nucleotide exchange factor [Mycena indigotica]|uniref:Rho guanyl-nucleotide exchange factor n=1 Tax=Mycena indigotica TaxID=2126181 RepID=A0A8H6T345_9AGAR|nr:Rho guanyl-nucleotide exchange factor [Mycena indigotica]KAF7309990.1 Rho guanyl-nucleotide exchange factor [Mycena indigotica]
MDRSAPMGPRAPHERSAAYEDIFGRRPAQQRPPPSSSSAYYQPHYPHFQQQPAHYQYPQQYGQPQYQQQAYLQPQQQYYNPSVHSSQQHPGYHPGVITQPPDRPPDSRGLTPAQAYQAQVAYGSGWADRNTPSPAPSTNGHPRHHATAPPALSIAIGEGSGRLGLNFDSGFTESPVLANGSGNGNAVEVVEEDDDEESELPWARRESFYVATPSPKQPPPQYIQAPPPKRYPQPHQGHRISSASDTPPQSLRSSVASSSPVSIDHEPVGHSNGYATSQLSGTTLASRRSSEASRNLPRLMGPRRERTAQDRAMSMSAVSSNTPISPMAGSSASSLPTIASASNKKPRTPIVYPAMLSRVAEAFRARVPVNDRVKDGLTYHDAFDGREAVDRIAHIIKTTDRNLALLLGRALDAQKFFHDVTYDHRLRDSVTELYQFRTKLPSPFASGEVASGTGTNGSAAKLLGAPVEGILSPDSFDAPTTIDLGHETDEEEELPLPTGVFTLLADCYSPTCSRDQLCYSIACPRRLEQQARLNMKPQPGLRKEPSHESLHDNDTDSATLWIHSVPAEIIASVSDTEKKRQEAINEVIYTERDFVRDMEYLRDMWVARLAAADIIPTERREQFLIQVFWNAHDIITVNTKLRDALNKRQRAYAVVEKIGDIFLDAIPHFEPFVSYGAHQLYGKYEFEKEKSSNPAFAAFVEATERLPESRKLELNAYLTKPTTRLARYPLLLEAVLKHTPDDSPDKHVIPQVVAQVRALLSRVNEESGRAENRFNLAQLDSQLVFKPGEKVELRLQEDGRELVYKGILNKRDGELQVYLFDHALLFAKLVKTKTHDIYRVYRRPIPLELLLVTASSDETTNSKDTLRGQRTRQLVRRGSFVRPDAKGPNWINFSHLGRKMYSLVLWAGSPLAQRKWMDNIIKQQVAMRERSTVFDTIALSEGFFVANKVNCAAPFSAGRRIAYGTDDGVYFSDLREINKDPVKVLALQDVTQVDILEDYQLLIVLSERQVFTFPLEALDPKDPMAGHKRMKRIATHTSFFKAGFCLGRVLVCIVKSTQLSSTFKALEPIEQNVRGRAKPTFKKLLQGGNDTLKPFREFYIPVESTSIHYLKTRLCIGCSKGFEIVDLESLETQGLLDPADESLEFVRKRENLRPMAIYRINNEFLLCYDEFAFYVNKTGRRSRKDFMVFWEGTPTGFALHEPYVLAFEPSFVEIRHIETGLMSQVIQGSNLRLLFADTPPSVNNGGGAPGFGYAQQPYDPYSPPGSANSRVSAYGGGGGGYGMPPYMQQYPNQYPHQAPVPPRYPQGVGRDEILMVSDDRVLALRTSAGPQRFMSDNVSMMSIPR